MTTSMVPQKALRLVSQVKQCHTQAEKKFSESLEWVLKAGELLCEMKDACGHGQFGGLVEQYLPFSERTARSYMKLHKDLGKLPKRQSLPFLSSANSVSGLQKLLAKHSSGGGSEAKTNGKPKPSQNRTPEPEDSIFDDDAEDADYEVVDETEQEPEAKKTDSEDTPPDPQRQAKLNRQAAKDLINRAVRAVDDYHNVKANRKTRDAVVKLLQQAGENLW